MDKRLIIRQDLCVDVFVVEQLGLFSLVRFDAADEDRLRRLHALHQHVHRLLKPRKDRTKNIRKQRKNAT